MLTEHLHAVYCSSSESNVIVAYSDLIFETASIYWDNLNNGIMFLINLHCMTREN